MTKEAIWQARIEAWRASRQTQARYCREQGFSLATFNYWKKRLLGGKENKLVRLPLQSMRRRRMCLILPDGIKLVFAEGAPLSAVTHVLEQLCASSGIK